ncbi:hypothetical protein [Demequina sp. NBRC 110055]|uniref:hypothetical protein n=1 Tax=Demequina sp. NBRC 110055 TaxID=1570344 RepID=UPI001186ED92|nr:hypothetical protein [Demequina sp. NBRC 110055]
MMARQDCALMVAPLLEHPGVSRVVVAHADGVAHFDTASLEEREKGAAAAAMAAATAAVVGGAMGLEGMQGHVVYAAEKQVVSRPVGSDAILLVVAEMGPNGDGVYPLVRRIGRELESGEAPSAVIGDSR